ADPDAAEFLRRAQQAMLAQAQRIADDQERQGFLENVSVNREIKVLWGEHIPA
ncbi:MAG TPA: hypothetical protein G4N98_08035, partial [Thermoflexia bacterium]|nr:hypothetical protein [Thermoflexia bacterium]